MMKASELRTKDLPALEKELEALLREQFNLRMQSGSGQLVNPHNFGRVRREIARVKTIMGEKKVGEA